MDNPWATYGLTQFSEKQETLNLQDKIDKNNGGEGGIRTLGAL